MNKFFHTLKFKSWYYFVVFALSILFLLLFFQLILFEPFYKNTVKGQVRNLTDKVAEVYFAEEYQQKDQTIKSLTMSSEACILILDKTSEHAVGYNSLGEYQCVIYAGSTVNEGVISRLEESELNSIMIEDNIIELSNQESLIYGEKFIDENGNLIYIFANVTLQNVNNTIRTIESQLFIITAIVLALSILIAFLFSDMLSTPIIQITNEAKKLQSGVYDLNFDDSGIDEMQQLADTVDLAAKEISKVEEYRKELMSNVSHDIKTPLTMIKAYAEMIRDISGDNPEKRNEHVGIILSETDYLSKLVSDMLDLNKLQSGNIDINMEPFDLSTLINNISERFETLAEKDNIHIEMECEPELIALGDENRINEVLYNFITNAFKHVGKDRLILVRAHLTDREHIRIEIVDHGSGIEEKYLPYIWDRYFKLDKHYKRSQTGSGLGLAINKAILELHDAEYGVESVINKGSTFFFVLKSVTID